MQSSTSNLEDAPDPNSASRASRLRNLGRGCSDHVTILCAPFCAPLGSPPTLRVKANAGETQACGGGAGCDSALFETKPVEEAVWGNGITTTSKNMIATG
ncbi:unnamed protein product [Symbiodinium natans]|uniref:Uncharacterized protein n=1 Tax=Symbiodinium natans TaxID=878477 RepID=A0A812SIL2_9DINO|nr:unnamed protein product [Symbiodinium natans]